MAKTPKLSAPIDEVLIERLKTLQGKRSTFAFSKVLGVSLQTLALALAGSRVHPGTRALLRQRADELSGGNGAPLEGAAA